MAKTRRPRKSYTAKQRATILAAAQKDRLTAEQVQKRFGVKPVTYYSWRKKTGIARRRGTGPRSLVVGTPNLSSHVRAEVRSRVQQILPAIVRSEVNHYLDGLFGSGRKRRLRA